MTLVAAFLAALVTATGAHAWTPSAAAVLQLERGGVVAEVTGDGPGTGIIHGAVDITAPPAVVWRLITDCARAPRMAPAVRSCRIIASDPDGRWDEREMQMRYGFLFRRVRSRFRNDFESGRRIAFTCLPGGDFRACQGEWRLEALPGGGTRVIYENRLTSDLPVPAALVRTILRMDVPNALRALRREAMAGR